MPAPFKPVIRDELDVSNFAEEFTEMDPTYSPAALPQNCDRIFQVGGGRGVGHVFTDGDAATVRRSSLNIYTLQWLVLFADVCLGCGSR